MHFLECQLPEVVLRKRVYLCETQTKQVVGLPRSNEQMKDAEKTAESLCCVGATDRSIPGSSKQVAAVLCTKIIQNCFSKGKNTWSFVPQITYLCGHRCVDSVILQSSKYVLFQKLNTKLNNPESCQTSQLAMDPRSLRKPTASCIWEWSQVFNYRLSSVRRYIESRSTSVTGPTFYWVQNIS